MSDLPLFFKMYFGQLFVLLVRTWIVVKWKILALTGSSIVYPLTGDIGNGYLSVSVGVGKEKQSDDGNVFQLLVVY